MTRQTTTTNLDSGQIFPRVYQEDQDAIRTVPAEATAFDVVIDASSDSVGVQSVQVTGTADITNASVTGTVIGPLACLGLNLFQLYCLSTTAVSGTTTARIDVSPQDSGSAWFPTTTTLNASASADTTVQSAVNNSLARRVRVVLTANGNGVAETCSYYLVSNHG